MNKKGFDITAEAWKVIIPAVVVLILFLYVNNNINKSADANSDNSACKSSVIENSKARLGSVDWSSEIKCPMQSITITETDDTKLMAKTAEAMYTCWDNFGRGEYNIFPTKRGAQDVFCAICSEITYTENKHVTGFMEYLMANGPPMDQNTYFEEFTGRAPTKEELSGISTVSANDIDTNSKYAVVFTYSKGVGFYDRFVKGGAFGGGGAVLATTIWGLAGFFTGGVGWVVGLGLIGVTGISAGAYGFITGPSLAADWAGGVHILPMDAPNLLSDLQCTKLGVKP